ncbi:MAG: hypothetical protein HY958_00700, partial [Bacteroidia bacterium]|nr:hypothetical protein [Bacteroidia bacterium]
WYAVGGELDGNSARARGGGGTFYGGGFYKSTDNGETWNSIATNLIAPNGTSWNSYFSYAPKVIVNPTTGNVFVGSNAGVIIKSTDKGSTWTTVWGQQNDHYYADLIINNSGVMISYLSQLAPPGANPVPSPPPGLFKSTNDGSTWTNITPVDFPTSSSRSVMSFSTSNPNLIYTLTNTGNKIGSTTKDDVRLFKINISTGVSTDLSANLPDFIGTKTAYIDTQNDYNMAIAVHPANENIVFIAGTNLFRSLDGFATKLNTDPKTNWIGGYAYTSQNFFYPALHPDIHTIVFDQGNPNWIWVGHDGGISYAPDATTTNYTTLFPWVDRDNLYNVTQYYTMAISQSSGDTRIFGGTQDNGTPFFRWNGTSAASSSDITTGDGGYSYLGTQFAYGSTQNGSVVRYGYNSSNNPDQSVSWSTVTPDGASGMKFVNPYAVDPNNEDYMYFIAGNMLWRNNTLSTIPNYVADKTTVGWSSVDLQLSSGYTFSTLAVSRTPANILYLAASSSNGQPKIYKMSNSKTATTATDITPAYSTASVPNGAYIHGIAIHPDNADEVLAVISNYNVKSLWYTSNGGSSWSDVEGNFSEASVRSATILPTSGSSKVYLIATSVG